MEHFDVVAFLMAYESGQLTQEQVIAGFQELVSTGLVWQLQGSYGRQAQLMIEDGLIHP